MSAKVHELIIITWGHCTCEMTFLDAGGEFADVLKKRSLAEEDDVEKAPVQGTLPSNLMRAIRALG